jgi:N-methylhydantoinase A
MTTETSLGDVPIRVPALDIHTVGAGGGSVARFDTGGALRVGPESAGAMPGPACYGTGTELTVTDATPGRLEPDYFLRSYAARRRHARHVAKEMARRAGLTIEARAEGTRVANSSMSAIAGVARAWSDPRRFTLVAFGGPVACTPATRGGADRDRARPGMPVWSAVGMPAADARATIRWPCSNRAMRSHLVVEGEYAPLVHERHDLLVKVFGADDKLSISRSTFAMPGSRMS